MTRFWACTILAFSMAATGLTQAGGDKEFRVQGKFTEKDPRDDQRKGPMQTHVVPLKKGKTYNIDMVSTDVDSYLRLLDDKGKQLDEDDDSGGDQNARIVFDCPKDGMYKIVCTTFAENMLGDYTLTVKVAGVSTAQPPATAHARLIGKSAPDFQADFVVNGKRRKLADFKGKVVLLDFCDIRNSSSTALVPHLNRWHKDYAAKGLAIVGLTFYTSDIDQPLGFDKEQGRVVTVKQADRASDRVLLAAFAVHHKIEHPVLALSKEAALATNDAYVVNGVPQLVLIDRKGIIRLIDLGGEKSSAAVETEIKKLLAEK
jgi:hypothetical protein